MRYTPVLNLILFQVFWWVLTLGLRLGFSDLALIGVSLFLLIHFVLLPKQYLRWRAFLGLVIAGIAMDYLLMMLRIFELRPVYDGIWIGMPAALVLMGYWVMFIATLLYGLRFLFEWRSVWVLLCFSLGGALTYFSGFTLGVFYSGDWIRSMACLLVAWFGYGVMSLFVCSREY